MKKLIKPLKYLGSAVLLFIGLLYLINFIPTKLDPRVEEIQKRPGLGLQSKEHPLPELVEFMQKRDHKSVDDLKQYGKLLETGAYPTDLRFPNTVKIAVFPRWNQSYLEYLSDLKEIEKYQGFSRSLKFIEAGLRDPDTLVQSLILMSALKTTARQLAVQKIAESQRMDLQDRIAKLLDERVVLLQRTLDKEIELQVYFISNTKSGGWAIGDVPLWEKALSPLFMPFFNVNETLNESYQGIERFKTESQCLREWTCKAASDGDEFQLWKNPRNPIGKMLLRIAQPGIQSSLMNIQKNWREIQSTIRQAQI